MRRLVVLLLMGVGVGCGPEDEVIQTESFLWGDVLPVGFPVPRVPEDNPMTYEKIELGRHLFYNPLLSENRTQHCGSCHLQEFAFSDPNAQAMGSTGEVHPRGSMSLANVAYANTLTWANPLMRTLEDQMLVPLFGEDPIELGLTSQETLITRVKEDELAAMFVTAFPDEEDPITLKNITRAIASFQRRLISGDSPYDRYQQGETDALNESARRGMDLFFSERFECFHCHGGFSMADSVTHEGLVFESVTFHNNGLYNVDGFGMYPEGNGGVFEISGVLEDSGRYKAPTLRNIALTAPYMHDGSLATLDDVLDHYARGGTLTEDGPNAGDGALNRFKSEFVNGFDMDEQEREDLLAFLEALTDENFVSDPALADPYGR